MAGVYITIDDIVPDRLSERAVVQLTRDGAEDTIDTDLVDRLITDAEALVDGYVGARYDLTAVHDQVPALVCQLAATVVVYRLHRRRPNAMTEALQAEYRDAISTLENISRGVVSLGVQPHPASDTERLVRSGGSPRRLTRTTMEGW